MVPCIISNLFFARLFFSRLACVINRPPTNQQYVWSTIPLVVKLIEQSSGLAPILVIRSTVPPGTTLKWEAEVRAKTDKPFQARTKKSLLSGLVFLVENFRMMARKFIWRASMLYVGNVILSYRTKTCVCVQRTFMQLTEVLEDISSPTPGILEQACLFSLTKRYLYPSRHRSLFCFECRWPSSRSSSAPCPARRTPARRGRSCSAAPRTPMTPAPA